MRLSVMLLLLVAGAARAVADGPTIINLNMSERSAYPTLESVSRAFSERQRPEVMFQGVSRRFREASLDEIAESAGLFIETRPANLCNLVCQVIALGNLTTRLQHGEPVRAENRDRLLRELSHVAELKARVAAYLQNVPARNLILIPYGGRARDIRVQIDRIEHDCTAYIAIARHGTPSIAPVGPERT